MNAQSAKTPTPSESVTITLTPNERYLLLGIIEAVTERVFTASSPSEVDWLEPFVPVSGNFRHLRDLNFKLQDTLFKSGDACRHSAQSSDAVGQGGIILDTPMNRVSVPPEAIYEDSLEAPGQGGFICYACENRVSYLFDDARCKDCTRLTPEEVQGNVRQGGTISCTDLPDCRCSECLDFLKREYDATEGQFCFVCSCDPCVCGPDPVGQGGNQ
jgi:hypothetical protein